MHTRTRCIVLVFCLFVWRKLKPFRLSSFAKWLIITSLLERLTSLKEVSIIKLGKSKLKQIYKRENLWEVVYTKINTKTFPITVNGAQITKNQLIVMRTKVMFIVVLLVKDDLFDIVTHINNPYNDWEVLNIFSQTRFTLSRWKKAHKWLSSIKELKTQLAVVGEKVEDAILIQIMLNAFSPSYESFI